MRTTIRLTLAVLALLFVGTPLWAQEEPPDLVIYRQIYAAETPTDKRIELCETFLADTRPEFWESTYRSSVFLNLYTSYQKEKNWTKLLDLADRIEKVVPKMPPEDRIRFYLDAMGVASREVKDIKKAIGFGERVIALDPNNLNALLTLATAIPPLPSDAGERKKILIGIVDITKKVRKLDRPDAVPVTQWQDIQKTVQIQGLTLEGTVLLDEKDYVGCAKTYEELTSLDSRSTAAFYRLGICYYYQAREVNDKAVTENEKLRNFVLDCNKSLACDSDENKTKIRDLTEVKDALLKTFDVLRGRAMDAFARCVAIGGAGTEVSAARSELEKLYKTIDPVPPYTLEEFITQRKTA